MTSLDDAIDKELRPQPAEVATTSRVARFELLLGRLSERLNPILVKEARQAVRSRQFIVTFFLMLSAGWFWSILGLALMGPSVYYSADGPSMFYVYYLILSLPLLVVAPFSAYHSLAAERQDRTYELVSITALNARQILSGKLGGTMLQMMIYLSAIFPCLAFTYLLRGLDIFTILFVVAYTCCISLGLSALGLLLATLAPPRTRLNASAVLFALLLVIGFFTNLSWSFGLIATSVSGGDFSTFWTVVLMMLTFYVDAFALAFLAARSQLMTVNQNRSTALRVALVVAPLTAVAWFTWGQLRYSGNFVFGLIFCGSVFWWLAGVFLVGEPQLRSPRVQRDLPQTLLGRVFLSLFMPGPGSGYLFVIANMLAMSVLACAPYGIVTTTVRAAAVSPRTATALRTTTAVVTVTRGDVAATCVVAVSYIVIFLGISKWLLARISRVTPVTLTVRTLVNVLLMMAGVFVPLIIQISNRDLRNVGYTLLQITNPVWTLWECCGKGIPIVGGQVLVFGLPVLALAVWLANLPSLNEELRQLRAPKPPRVSDDDAQLVAAVAGPPGPKSPWD